MKKLLSALLSAVMAVSFATGCDSKKPDSGDPVTQQNSAAVNEADVQSTDGESHYNGFYVEGTKLMDANGNEFIFRGINHAHTWFKDQDDVAIPAIAATGSNSIRIVLANGIQWGMDNKPAIERLIKMCKENNLVAIVEVHDGTGDDSIETLEKIADYWIDMKDALIGTESYVILNIANEWIGTWKSETWRDGYVSVIPRIREAGIENTIMVDSAGWGQYGKCIQDYGKEVFDSDPLANTMFSVHMYGAAGKNEETIRSNIEGATNQGLCICVGEFGYNHSDGDVDEAYIMKYCEENGIGYLGWSWKGNGGGVEYLDLALEWDGSALSEDWGENLVNGTNGIKNTSKVYIYSINILYLIFFRQSLKNLFPTTINNGFSHILNLISKNIICRFCL